MQPRRLNGYKKVCYCEFFKASTRSTDFFSPAVKAGLPKAQYYFGDMYETGVGVEVNLVKAFGWYQKGMLS
jgi:TPR repeat protein